MISMSVRYKTIRRILVGFRNMDNRDNLFSLELYFHVSSPPLIRRIRLFQDVEKQTNINLLTRHGDRFTAWDKRRKYLTDEINQSPIFKIVLTDINVSVKIVD